MYQRLTIIFVLVQIMFAHEPKVMSAETVSKTPFPGHATYLLSDADTTPSEIAVLELSLPPKTFGAPAHIHTKEDEHFYVLEGEVDFLNNEEIITVAKGGLIILPRGNLHGFWNGSDKNAKLLLIVSPGKFASFFDQVVATIRKENPNDPKRVGEIIAQEAAKFGVSIHPDKTPPKALSLLRKK